MILAHQAAERSLARTSSASRVRALRRLLSTADRGAAEELGLDLRRRYHCLIADVATPREASTVDALIRTADGASGLVGGMLCRVTGYLPVVGAGSVLVIASPPATIEELPAAHALCCQAAEIARQRGDTGLRSVSGYAVDLAVRGQPLLSRFLTDDLLAGLDPGNPFHRQLAETAHTYLSHGGRLDVTSSVLHVHPNTVAHRLRRLGTLTGFAHTSDAAGDFAATCRWWWALDAWLLRTGPG
jgi:hypothetical protein